MQSFLAHPVTSAVAQIEKMPSFGVSAIASAQYAFKVDGARLKFVVHPLRSSVAGLRRERQRARLGYATLVGPYHSVR